MNSITEKKCSSCKEIKDISLFHKDRSTKDGFGWRCTPCKKIESRDFYEKNKIKIKETQRRYQENNSEKYAEMQKKSQNKYYKNSINKIKDRYLKSNYGITKEEYEAMLSKQGGVCAVCGNTNRDGRMLSVDHDHTSGKIRELLCQYCNASLGMARDDIGILEKLRLYLIRHME